MLSHIVTPVIGSLVGGFLGPFERSNKYLGNNNNPNEIPGLDVLSKLWYSGLADVGDVYRGFQALGVSWEPYKQNGNLYERLWQSTVEMSRPQMELPQWVDWWRQGRVSETQVQGQLQRMGLDRRIYWPLIRDNWENLGADAVRDAVLRGKISPEDGRKYYYALGFTRQQDQDLLLNETVVLSPAEALVATNRKLITETELEAIMRWHGWRNDTSREAFKLLRYEIPGGSDLTRYAVRHVFEPSLATRFGFDAEMPADYIDWHARQGLGQEFQITDPIDHKKYDMTWAKANWWSHWVWPAPTQAYMMLQRMRKTGGVNNGPRSPTGLTFDMTDLSFLLRGNDYPPHWRPYLAAISYNVPTRGDVEKLYTLGMIDRNEAIEKHQDQGYTLADATTLTDMIGEEQRWRQIQALRSRQMQRIMQAYQVGVVDKPTAATQLFRLSLPNLAAVTSFENMGLLQQQQIALADLGVEAQLNAIDAKQAASLATEALGAIKRLFLRFEINAVQATNAMQVAGFTPTRTAEHLRIWQLILVRKGKDLPVSKVLRSYERGIINANDANARLINAGYSANDAAILLADAGINIAMATAKARQAAAKTVAQAQKAQAALVAAQQRQLAKQQATLARHGSPAKLVRWLKRGLISEAEADARLSALGWPPADIRRLVDDALTKGSTPITTKPTVPPPAP